MTKREKLIDLLQEMEYNEMVALHNEYCQMVNKFDDEIFDVDMFDELLQGLDPFEIACKVHYGDFNGGYEYFKFNAYGNIQSICKWEIDRFVDINEIADYILDENYSFENNDILYILDDVEGDSEQ
jgi:hypothetical protein